MGTQHSSPRPRPTIGLLINHVVSGDQSSSLWAGVVDETREQGASVFCFAGNHLREPYDFNAQGNVIYSLIDKERIDGLIIWTSSLSSYVGHKAIKDFCEHYRPLPLVGIGMLLDGIPSLVLDSYGGMREAIVHLIEAHGRRRLAFIRGPEGHYDATERYRAYTDVLQEYGLPFVPDLVSPPYGWVEQEGEKAIHLLLDQRRARFDAVVAVNDHLAIGALRVLQSRGIHVPDDVALVGFNNELVCKLVTPPLTTVPIRMYERGRLAIRTLLAMIKGEQVPERASLPTRLIVRQSCGCLDPAVMQAAVEEPATRVTSPKSRPPNRTKASDLESLAARREQILLEIERAVEPADGIPRLASPLLDAFMAELSGQAAGVFLPALENVLRQVTEAGGNVIAWQRAISVLRRQMLLYLPGNDQTLTQIDNLWHQARVMIGERARRQQAYQDWQINQLFDKLHQIGQALTVALNVSELMNILARELPQLGISSCYLSLYEDPEQPDRESRLLLAYDERGRIELPATGQQFPSRQLIPDGFLSLQKQGCMIIEPLYFREEPLGFAIFEEEEPAKGHVTRLLRNQISSALKDVQILADNVDLYHQALQAQQVAQEGQRLAEEANLLKSRFLSMVSHELLTPLVLLVGLSEMMLREGTGSRPPLPEPYRQDLARIHVSAQQLGSLVRDVLDLTRSQMGQLKLTKRPLDLGETLKAVALVGEQLASSKGLTWRAEIPGQLPKVWGDPTRLQQVTLNLVTNAVKFTARGEITLQVEVSGPVEGVSEEMVTVLVSDTGLGVPPAEWEVIFDEFRQSERTALRGYGGLGVGLAICRRLVELHGGQIGVRPPGNGESGSTFYFTLPTIGDEIIEEVNPEVRSQRVLLLTEQTGGGIQLQEHLTRQGFQVEVLGIGEAPHWISAILASPPGAVVLDFQPASEQGWELIRALKENPATQNIPVVFYSLPQEQESGSVLALDYLVKPMGTTALAQTLQRLGLGDNGCENTRSILVVDDDPAILEMHTRVVQTYLPDCRVLQATNGRIALEMMRQERPSLVLLDLMMPELDGVGVLEAMQEDERIRSIPVIVLTAQMLTQEDMARLNRSVAAVLEKGLFSPEETLAHIEQVLARNKNLGSEIQRTVRKVMAYIHEHYAQPISREDMAAHAGISARYLTRCFQQEMGVSPITYLNRYRIKQAKLLLQAGEKNITEVADAVGFSNNSYFARVFRREVGLSPRDYQREN
ncbi:MAG: substrate-binding domain-containing protein [Anaerolineae bacterium]|nr:substrate-binding domain-containing protein [Anaerolineae bacterium]